MPFPIMALALAAALPQDTGVEVGFWHVGPTGSGTCQAVAQFGDHVSISIEEDSGGAGHFFMSDDRWLLKEGDTKRGKFSWHEDTWSPPVEVDFRPIHMKNGNWMLVAETGPWMTENLLGAKKFWLSIPGLDFDDDFNVPNAADVTSALQACNAKL